MSVLRSRTISCLLTGVLAGLVLAPDGRSQEQSTFVGLSISDGIVTEEYTFVDEIIPGGPPTVSIIDATTLAPSTLTAIGTGSARAELGQMGSRVTGHDPTALLLSVAGFTDTVTLFADGQEGAAGTLHLDYELDGSVFVKAGSIASVSLNLVNFDLPELENLDDPLALEGADTYSNHTEFFFDLEADISQTFDPEINPIPVSLQIPIEFGQPVNYGAALFLLLYGEGDLDFSQTLHFTGASVTDASDGELSGVGIQSAAGMGYAGLVAVPEPSVGLLLAVALACGATRRRSAP